MIPAMVLGDSSRMAQFRQIGNACRLLKGFEFWLDPQGVAWGGRDFGDWNLGFAALGQGWVFDRYCQQQLAREVETARAAMTAEDNNGHQNKLLEIAKRLSLGGQTERLLFAIHQRVVQSRQSVVRLPDAWLARLVWGRRRPDWPRHWRRNLLIKLNGLAWLHIADVGGTGTDVFGAHTSLINNVAELENCSGDEQCDSDCPQRGSGPHRHYHVNIGRGFLGVLEGFAHDDIETGVRTYEFPARAPRGQPSLQTVGRTGQLITVYLPAILGEPAVCSSLSGNQRRLLGAVIRETTRVTRKRRTEVAEAEVLPGNVIPAARGKGELACPLLCADDSYVGFNGNKKRKGLGYYLMSPGGWLHKAGYAPGSIDSFLRDLGAISDPLGLTPVGVHAGTNEFLDLVRMQSLSKAPSGRRVLERVHLRLYTPADFLDRWNAFFGWECDRAIPESVVSSSDILGTLALKRISRRELAAGIGADPSFISKLFSGKKPWPPALLDKARAWAMAAPAAAEPQWRRIDCSPKCTDALTMALAYRGIGWSIVPQQCGAKKPTIRWKPFQTELPTEKVIRSWYQRTPSAGVVLVLGPLSGVLVIDVDGREAHETLVDRVGEVPVAPKVISGSGKPYRYHLFFQHPDLATKAKVTPWHPQLEFRGAGGIVVLPPSRHPSGCRYQWAKGASLNDLPLPALPPAILSSLSPSLRPIETQAGVRSDFHSAGPSTRGFLAGQYSEGPNWNDRLFRAACDLQGRGVTQDVAEPLLLAGAKPWNQGEQDSALATIKSAYSQARLPSWH